MRNILLSGLSIFFTLLGTIAYAINIQSPYTAEVIVHSQSTEERLKATESALAQVFIAITKNDQILAHPHIKQQLTKAPTLVQQFGYTAAPSAVNTEKLYLLRVYFDPQGVDQCLQTMRPTHNNNQEKISLKITGIHHQSDIDQLMSYLGHLKTVANVNLSAIHGTDILLKLSLHNTEEFFLQTVSKDQRLSAINQKTDKNPTILRWNPIT
jgi:hypothetical protein